jgi:hypothetical protein
MDLFSPEYHISTTGLNHTSITTIKRLHLVTKQKTTGFFINVINIGLNVALSPSTDVRSENALPYSWSMIFSIRIGSRHVRSGTILEDSYILTAAHCLTNRVPQDITIEAGMHYRTESGTIIRQVDRIYIHPNYTA